MSTKKSRKRAYIPPSHEVVNRRERDTTTRTVNTRATRASNPRQAGGRTITPPKPSLKRTAKRLPIYFIMILALQYFMLSGAKGDRSSSDILLVAAVQAGIVTVAFAPIMHWLDRLAYNRYLKKTGTAPAEQ